MEPQFADKDPGLSYVTGEEHSADLSSHNAATIDCDAYDAYQGVTPLEDLADQVLRLSDQPKMRTLFAPFEDSSSLTFVVVQKPPCDGREVSRVEPN